MDYAGSSEQYNYIIAKINIGFCIIFSIEVLVKLTGFGFRYYFSQRTNIFDFVITTAGIIDVLPLGSSINLTALRILRVARLLRLIKASKTLQD